MAVSRRNFIIGGAAFSTASLPHYAAGFDQNSPTLFVVLDGLERVNSISLTAKVLDIFFAKGVPVTALLPCSGSSGLAGLLMETLAKEQGLFDVAVDTVVQDDPQRYFRLRAAIDLRDCIAEGAGNETDILSPTPIVSILNRNDTKLLDPFALRGAGFRIQLRPDLDGDKNIISARGAYQVIDWGLAQITGGASASVQSDPNASFAPLDLSQGAQAFYLSFSGVADVDEETLLSNCADWATRLQHFMLKGEVFFTRPMDHLLQGNPGASKYVGLALDMAGQTPALTDFAQQLTAAGFPFTYLAPSDEGENCPTSPDGACQYLSDSTSLAPESIAKIIVQHNNNPYVWSGPRSDGRYHVALRSDGVENFAAVMEQDPLTDTVLTINAAHVATRVQQFALLGKLSQARSDGKAHFYSIRGYLEQTAAPDPVIEHFWSTRRRQVLDPPRHQTLDQSEKAAFMEDARLAWQFIDRYTDETTGICAGTVKTSASDTVNPEVTLWDVASQIHGIISAHFLEIITDANARDRVDLLLSHMPTTQVDGLSLPPALFSAANPAHSRNEFDACDTGRFLIALNSLVNTGLVTRQRALAVLEPWDISETVRDGHLFTFTNGAWENVTESHCSHYARNGYVAWGRAVITAYPRLLEQDNGDSHLRLLYEAANIGHFGTEPLLLEAVETGFSPETQYLSDVLFDAQLSWFEQTGQFKCVSEAALDFAPWFSYQGLRVDRRGQDSWVISTIDTNAAYQSASFQAGADLISSKAAYLWAAVYPHDYSSRLIELIRDKAKIENLGFSIGIFGNTQSAMKGYSDVNTNGIILMAIAEILKRQ